MAETFKCPNCGKSLALLKKQAGKKGRCQACGTVFVVPGSASQETNVPASSPKTPPAPAAGAAPRAAQSRAAQSRATEARPAAPPNAAPPAQPVAAEPAGPVGVDAPARGEGGEAHAANRRLTVAVVAAAVLALVAIAACVLVVVLLLNRQTQVVVIPAPAPASPAPAPAPVVLPPTPSIDTAQLQKALEQVQFMAELSQAAQKIAVDPQAGLDALDRLGKKQPAAAGAPQGAAGEGQAAPAGTTLEQKLSGMVAGLNELADALAAIQDEPGARAALVKVRETITRTVTLLNAPMPGDASGAKGLAPNAVAEYNAKNAAAMQRVEQEVARVTPIPGTQEVVAEVNRFLGQLRAVSQRP